MHSNISRNTGLCSKFSNDGFGFAQTLAFTIHQINKNPEILPHLKLGYDIRDYCDYPLKAIAATYDFVNNWPDNRVVGVIGPEDSGTALKVVGLLQVKRIPLISFSASSQELTNPMFSNFFRTIPPDTHQSKAIADIIEYFNWTYVAIIAVDDSYGRYGAKGIEDIANKRSKFCIAFIEYVTRTGYKNRITDIVRKLKYRSNIKTIVLWATEVSSRRFLDEAQRQQLFDRTFLISDSLATNDLTFFEKYYQVLKGCFGLNPIYQEYDEYRDYMETITPAKINTSQPWKAFWEHEFNCSFDIVNSSSSCKAYNNQTMSLKTLNSMYNAFGSKIVDAVYAIAYALHEVDRCTRSNSTRAQCSNETEVMNPTEVTRFLHNVSFKGRSGRTKFDGLGDPLFSWYNVINVQSKNGRVIKENVGRWNQTIKIDDAAVEWINSSPTVSVCSLDCPPGTRRIHTASCCWKCSVCEDSISQEINSENCTKCDKKQKPNNDKTKCVDLTLENLQWSNPVSILLLTLSIIGLFVTAVACGIFLHIWTTPIVKASNRELSCVLFAAIFTSFAMAIFYLDPPSPVHCLVISPLRYVLNSICVTVLFLKTERIFHAFTLHSQHTRTQSVVCKRLRFGQSPFVGIFLLNFVQVALAVISMALDPSVIDEVIRPGQSIMLRCVPYTTNIGKALDIALLSYLVLMVVISTSYSFKARKIPENYNEGRCIVFSLYVIILSWIVYYPVHFTLDGPYGAVVSNASTLLCSYGLLVCIFFPKLYVIFFHPEKNTLEYARAQISKHTMSTSTSMVYVKNRQNSQVLPGSTTVSPEQFSDASATRSHVAI